VLKKNPVQLLESGADAQTKGGAWLSRLGAPGRSPHTPTPGKAPDPAFAPIVGRVVFGSHRKRRKKKTKRTCRGRCEQCKRGSRREKGHRTPIKGETRRKEVRVQKTPVVPFNQPPGKGAAFNERRRGCSSKRAGGGRSAIRGRGKRGAAGATGSGGCVACCHGACTANLLHRRGGTIDDGELNRRPRVKSRSRGLRSWWSSEKSDGRRRGNVGGGTWGKEGK